jgi:hypothetical protein
MNANIIFSHDEHTLAFHLMGHVKIPLDVISRILQETMSNEYNDSQDLHLFTVCKEWVVSTTASASLVLMTTDDISLSFRLLQ